MKVKAHLCDHSSQLPKVSSFTIFYRHLLTLVSCSFSLSLFLFFFCVEYLSHEAKIGFIVTRNLLLKLSQGKVALAPKSIVKNVLRNISSQSLWCLVIWFFSFSLSSFFLFDFHFQATAWKNGSKEFLMNKLQVNKVEISYFIK